MNQDKRRWVRIRCSIKVAEEKDPERAIGISRNLSQHGIFLLTSHRFSIGEKIFLRLSYRCWNLPIQAKVAHLAKDGVGFEFEENDQVVMTELRGMINNLLAEGAWLEDRRTGFRKKIMEPLVWGFNRKEIQSTLFDLNLKGAFIQVDPDSPIQKSLQTQLEVGKRIILYLSKNRNQKDSEAIGCEATIRHIHPTGLGVEFLELTPEEQEVVQEILGPLE